MNSFEKELIKEINKFRENPQSILHKIDVLKRGLARLRPNDPFLKEMDNLINQLKNMKSMKKFEMNPILSKIAKSEVKKFTLEDEYNCYKQKKELKGIVPNEYINQDAALVADEGAEEASIVVPKILLNKLDTLKIGREILTNPNYTQIGIGHEVFEEENYIVVIFAKAVAQVQEEEAEVPDEDLSILKQADLFYRDGSQKIRVKEPINIKEENVINNCLKYSVKNNELIQQFDSIINNALKNEDQELFNKSKEIEQYSFLFENNFAQKLFDLINKLKEYNFKDIECKYELIIFLKSENEKLEEIINNLPLITYKNKNCYFASYYYYVINKLLNLYEQFNKKEIIEENEKELIEEIEKEIIIEKEILEENKKEKIENEEIEENEDYNEKNEQNKEKNFEEEEKEIISDEENIIKKEEENNNEDENKNNTKFNNESESSEENEENSIENLLYIKFSIFNLLLFILFII